MSGVSLSLNHDDDDEDDDRYGTNFCEHQIKRENMALFLKMKRTMNSRYF